MGSFVPHSPRRTKLRKGKGVATEEDSPDESENILRDFLASQENVDARVHFGESSTTNDGDSGYVPEFARASEQANQGLLILSRALDDRNSSARLAELRAEAAEREVARLRAEAETNPFNVNDWVEEEVARVRNECEANSRRAEALTNQRVRRANREGRREIAEEVKARRERFATCYSAIDYAHAEHGNYLESRGAVRGLSLTQSEGYSFDEAYKENLECLGKMSDMQPELLDFKARMWEQWGPIVVSPDSVEVGPEIPDVGGEVDQAPADVNTYRDSGSYRFDE